MMRCLEPGSDDVNVTFVRAKEIGLVKLNDRFYADGSFTVTADEFCQSCI